APKLLIRCLAQAPLHPRRNNQPRPTREETQTAQRRDRAQPTNIRQRHHIQTSAEQQNPDKKQPPRTAIGRSEKRQHKKRDRVNEMIKDSLVPDIDQAVSLESRLQPVRAKRTEADRQKTK